MQLKIGLIIDQTLAKEMESNLKKSVKLSDADIERYYREHLDKYATPERVKARHILVEKQDRARELLEQLRKGADFKELAKKNSTCPSAEKGGDLGWFGRGKMDPEFEKAAFAIKKKGETSDVVKSSSGITSSASTTGEIPRRKRGAGKEIHRESASKGAGRQAPRRAQGRTSAKKRT